MSNPVFIKKYSLLIYFALTFTISWGGILLLAGPGGIPIDTEKSENLMPFIYMAMLIGPSFAGILLTGLIDGRAGFRELLSRLLRWRIGAHWFAAALLATPLLASVVLLALSLLSPEFFPGIFTSGDKATLLLSGVTMGLMVGIFEEPGWTGFAVPRLRLRYNALNTGLIVGLLWGLWHFLVFWEKGSFSGALPLAILLTRLFSWLPPFRVLMVWIYDRTESLLVTMLIHASLVVATLIIVPLTLAGKHLLAWLLAWGAILWIVVVVITVARAGRLPRQPNSLKE
jgi:membrane protease YdiL (CAAX protease family)